MVRKQTQYKPKANHLGVFCDQSRKGEINRSDKDLSGLILGQ